MRPGAKTLWPSLVLVGGIYAAVFGADWIAPYDYYEQDRLLSMAPPTRLRFVDAEGRFHPRPFVYRLREHEEHFGLYIEDPSERYPLRFFVLRKTPRRWGPLKIRWQLFSVDESARVFLLGTDRFGRDQFSRLLYGGRISLGAGLLAGLAAVGLGLGIGAAAGYRGGYLDAFLMRLGELFMAFPALYLLVALRAALPLDLSATASFSIIVAVVALLGWVRPARLVRGIVLSARERDYVRAARGFGASDLYLVWRHILPFAWGVLITHLALLIPRLILAEVTLSFLGLGIAEPMPSWGLMLAELRQYDVLVSYWWMSIPAGALVGVILSYHRLAGALEKRLASPASL